MPGNLLNTSVELSGSWRRLEKKYGESDVSKYLDQLLQDLGEMTEKGLRFEYDQTMRGEYSGKLRRSIYSRRTGSKTMEAGLDLRAPGSRHHQNLYIYTMSQLQGWTPVPMSMKRIEDRIIPWVKKRFGYSGRQARAAAVGVVRQWLVYRRQPGRNFVNRVVRIPTPGNSSGLEGVFVGEYYGRAKDLHEQAYKKALKELKVT